MDFEKELTPMIDTSKPKKGLLRGANDTQYFTNIDGKYVKDAEARAELADVEEYVYGALEPWQPLEDGYSNFWFELTDDTLSPWLNFSAKNNDAVIDWGDGSGEVALDTLTPTHTYSKAGRYVVKVKGVTGIAAQHNIPYNAKYFDVLRYIELNNDVDTLGGSAFAREVALQKVKLPSTITTVGTTAFSLCACLKEPPFYEGITTTSASYLSFAMSLKDVVLPNTITSVGASMFYYAQGLNSITFPASCTNIGSTAFSQCYSLETIHVQATTPPTLGNNAFQSIAPNYIIYVPVGTAETYKAASGWSTYADHIVEEGSQLTRSQLRNIELENSKKSDNDGAEMR